jgi:ankyrin repeat protein
LVEKGASLDQPTVIEGLTPLLIAVKRGHLKIVNLLIERGASIELKMTNSFDSVLHLACEKGSLEILKILSTNDSFLKMLKKRNKQNQSPLDIIDEKMQNYSLESNKQSKNQDFIQ